MNEWAAFGLHRRFAKIADGAQSVPSAVLIFKLYMNDLRCSMHRLGEANYACVFFCL